MKKLNRIIAALIVSFAPFLTTLHVSAVADTCTWTGAVNSNWSNGGNWTGCDTGGVPEIGDSLIFPEGAINKSTNNDFVGAAFNTVQISGSGYTLSGGSITITGTTPLVVNQDATVNLDITYAPSMNAFLRVASGQTLTMNGITTFSGIGGEVNVGGGGFDGTIDFVGNIVGDAGSQFIATNDATAIVRGAANTFTSSTVGAELDGIFVCRSTTCFGDNANDIYSGNGIVEIRVSNTFSNNWQTSAASPGNSWLNAYDNVSISGNGTVNDSIGISQNMSGGSIQFTGSITNTSGISVFGVDDTAYVRFDGAVSGAGNFAFGSGTAVMSAANTYDGTNTVNAGAIVIVDIPTGLGSTAGITNVLDGGSVRFDFAADTTVTEPLQIAGSGIAGEGAIVQIDAGVTLSGDIALDGNATIGVDTAAVFSAFMLSGVISGTGDITVKTSPTTVVADSSIQFTGATANTYVGKLIVEGVRFYGSKASNINAVTGDIDILATSTKNSTVTTAFDESIADTSHVTLMNNGAFDAVLYIGSTASETVGYVTGDGEVSVGASSTLYLSSNTDYTYAGDISKYSNVPAGNSFIYKQGSGLATFSGGVNDSYVPGVVPGIVVSQGSFSNSGSKSLIPIAISNGTTLKGTGPLGYVTVAAGGTINVGNSPGCMTVATLDMTAGSTFTEEIAGSTVCSAYDQTTVTSTAALNNATLNVVLSYTPSDGEVFTIVAAGSVTGTFNGLVNGSTLTVSGVQFRVNYTSTAVTLTKLAGTVATTPTTSSPTAPLSNTGFAAWMFIVAGAVFVSLTTTLAYSTSRYTQKRK